MATLWIGDDHTTVIDNARELRDWLAGDWCLLFSHPEDFEPRGLEADRWLEIVRDACRRSRVRPLRYAAVPLPDHSWTARVVADDGIVVLARSHRPAVSAPGPAGDIADLCAHALHAELAAASSRCVFILDESLQRRGLLSYMPGSNRVSTLDLLASVQALRRDIDVRRAA